MKTLLSLMHEQKVSSLRTIETLDWGVNLQISIYREVKKNTFKQKEKKSLSNQRKQEIYGR